MAAPEHFEMFSATDLQESQLLLAELELFHAALQTMFGNPTVQSNRTTVVVFPVQRGPAELQAGV